MVSSEAPKAMSAGSLMMDPLFIFTFGLGVQGAAIATVISQGVSACWVVSFLCSQRSGLRIRWKNLRLTLEAPKAMSAGSLMMENTTVSAADKQSRRAVELPRICSAPSRSPAPRRMEAKGAGAILPFIEFELEGIRLSQSHRNEESLAHAPIGPLRMDMENRFFYFRCQRVKTRLND